jgi:hypothetical protein
MGYQDELGLDVESMVPSAITRSFVERMTRIFNSSHPTFLCGALLAFETVAVEEFRVVSAMILAYGERVGAQVGPNSLTRRYIAGHVSVEQEHSQGADPEMDHYLGMLKAVGASICQNDLAEVRAGFLSVCVELEAWWSALQAEAWVEGARSVLHRTSAQSVVS